MKSKKSLKILTSSEEIKDFMSIGEKLYQHLLKLGLPVIVINNRHYAHADNIENWWQKRTAKASKFDLENSLKKPCQEI